MHLIQPGTVCKCLVQSPKTQLSTITRSHYHLFRLWIWRLFFDNCSSEDSNNSEANALTIKPPRGWLISYIIIDSIRVMTSCGTPIPWDFSWPEVSKPICGHTLELSMISGARYHRVATYSVRKPVWSWSGSATLANPKSQICKIHNVTQLFRF